MTTGTEIKCISDNDMLEFMRWIRERGGEVSCIDWELKVLRVIRGTKNAEKVELFNVDGVLGAVNTDDGPGEDTNEADEKGRGVLLQRTEGNMV